MVVSSSALLDRVALFSDDFLYRYVLAVTWDNRKPYCCFIMLNPSIADHEISDPTVTRCVVRAKEWGYGGLVVLNIFALRSTNPKALYTCSDPIGPENDAAITRMAKHAGMVMLGYGVHGKLFNRGTQVLQLLRESGVQPMVLKLNKDGKTPAHPLYLSYDHCPVIYRG